MGPLGGEGDNPTIFVSTLNGVGHALYAHTGQLRWSTDADTTVAGNQPLGDALVASPIVSRLRNIAFFATRNLAGRENRVFAFDAKTGACRFVANGSCDGATGTLNLGQISAAPLHDATAQRLYVTSTSHSGGATVWAIDASDATGGAVLWSANKGDSDVSPAYVDDTRTSIFVGTNGGAVYRLQTSDGSTRWSADGSSCGDVEGSPELFCTGTDSRSGTCASGSAIVSGFFTVWEGTHAGRVVFVTADGHVRMIDGDGVMVWKTSTPIAGASFPLLLPAANAVLVGSTDGHLHQLDLGTGAAVATQQVGDGAAAIGSPVYDHLSNQLYVGSAEGRIYRFALPL